MTASATIAADPITAGIGFAETLLQTLAPNISQEQKESLLNAFKSRISTIQAKLAALAAAPADNDARLAVRDLSTGLCNAVGYPSLGLSALDLPVPMDTYASELCAIALLDLVLEQQALAGNTAGAGAATTQPVKA